MNKYLILYYNILKNKKKYYFKLVLILTLVSLNGENK